MKFNYFFNNCQRYSSSESLVKVATHPRLATHPKDLNVGQPRTNPARGC